MNYKIRVNSEAESKDVQELLFELGYKWFSGGKKAQHLEQSCSSSFGYLVAWSTGCFTNVIQCGCGNEDAKEITLPQLRDMVVLKRNDISDATHTDQDNWKWFIGSDGIGYVWQCGNADNLKQWDQSSLDMVDLKPIKKEVVMKEFLNPDQGYKLVACAVGETPIPKDWIEVPEGADIAFKGIYSNGVSFTTSDWMGDFFNGKLIPRKVRIGEQYKSRVVWQRSTIPEALPFIDDEPKYDPEDIGIAKGYDLDELAKEYKLRDRCDGETDEEYRYMLKHCIDLENYIAKETLNGKVASAEVARQSGVFVGSPFSDLPAFNFGAIDDFVESNVEQTLIDRESTYGSFSDVADTTSKLMGILLNSKNGQILPCTHQEALHMICSKMARIVNGDCNYKDNWHDIGGYAKLIENLIDGV